MPGQGRSLQTPGRPAGAGLGEGGAQQLVFEAAPSPLAYPAPSQSLLPVIPVSTLDGGGSRKRD